MEEEEPKKKKKTGQVFLIFGLLAGVVFLPTSVLLAVGMLPTPMAVIMDRTKKQAKLITVGAMNLAGCSFFLVDLWRYGNSFEKSIQLISDPMTLAVIYGFAGFGYVINWSVASTVTSAMQQRGRSRKKQILKRQEELVERWGEKVSGRFKLDEDGFPLEEPKKKEAKEG